MNYLIVGLGNPGEKYTETRHNIGWKILDLIYGEEGWTATKGTQAFCRREYVGGEVVELVKPTSFMNRSGSPVEYIRNRGSVERSNIIVIHDDVSLPFGSIRISFGRGAGGHNGVSSIIKYIGSSSFVRIRVGVSPVHLSTRFQRKFSPLADYVLGRFSKKEKEGLEDLANRTESMIEYIVENGVEATMNKYNK